MFNIAIHFDCPEDEYIFESAQQSGIDRQHFCDAGVCNSCAGTTVSGTVDQSDQSFLDDDQMSAGYSLLCVAYATSDLVIRTDCEEELW